MIEFLVEPFRQIVLTIIVFCDIMLNICFGLTDLKGRGELKNDQRRCI